MKQLLLITILATIFACTNQTKQAHSEDTSSTPPPKTTTLKFQNKGHELVYKVVQKTGDYQKLKSLKDVVYTYTYRTPDKKEDVSVEKYIFDGEKSFGQYKKHERTLPKLEGEMTQGYDGKNFWLKHKGEYVTDEKMLKRVTFTRKTNFYWFAMMQKLLDPGMNYKHLRQETLNDILYDVVEITYNVPEGQASDTYHLYINTKTSLIDQFLFTVVDYNVVKKPLIMRVTYQSIDGVMIPTYRKYTKASWKGEVLNEKWVEEIAEDIKFNQNISQTVFEAKTTSK